MAGVEKTNQKQCMNPYIDIPGGPFTMRSPEGVGNEDGHPSQQVTIPSFQIQEHEITPGDIKRLNEKAGLLRAALFECNTLDPNMVFVKGVPTDTEESLWRRAVEIAGDVGCRTDHISVERQPVIEIPMDSGWCRKLNSKGDDYPVVCLTQKEKEAYCASENATLPSGAQLEYVSFLGGETPNAVTYENSDGTTAAVCGPEADRRKNTLGVMDIEGNVSETTRDVFAYFGQSQRMPLMVFRGGSFFVSGKYAHAAFQSHESAYVTLSNDGFRCVRSIPSPEAPKK